jgi:hypothetical protein
VVILFTNFQWHHLRCGIALAATLLSAGCSGGSLNQNGELTLGLPVAGLPAAQAPSAPKAPSATAALEQRTITGFRSAMIIVFSGQDSHNGERMPTATMTLPLKARQLPGHPDRLEIMTVYGPRWIATSEVVVEPTPSL